MKPTLLPLALAVMLAAGMCGCADGLREVKIIEVVPERSEGWNTTYHHVVVEDTETRRRHIIVGHWGTTGDVFTVSKWSFHR